MSVMTRAAAKTAEKESWLQTLSARWRSYVGSVLFFKHLILLIVMVLIIVPWFFIADLAGKYYSAQKDIDRLEQTLTNLTQHIADEARAQASAAEEARMAQEAALAAEQAARDAEEAALTEALTGSAPHYQELYPDFYAPQTLSLTEKPDDTIYLTFDDGPSPRTPEVLEILREKEVKATFFVVGQNDEESLQWMRDIVAEGHTIGMHSYSHQYKKLYTSVESFLEDMYQNFSQIKEATGVTPTVFRFPGGSINAYNTGINQDIITEMLRRGFVPYDWNISSEDAASKPPSAATIVAGVTAQAQRVNRGVVLMHDSDYKYTTVAALPEMIELLKEQGFSFSAITPSTQPVLFDYRS